MLSREENELVCRVGPGTPMGQTLRRYWLPICTSAEIGVPDSDPLRAPLLGQTFVVFRDSNGDVGVLDELCPHRGASLALGRVEEGGIRCLYHGWKFGVDGATLDIPNHRDAEFRQRVRACAYPVREVGSLVWTYIGPPERQPPFPRQAFMTVPEEHRTVFRVNTAANYLQMLEGGFDSSHVGVLHSNVARPGWMTSSFAPSTDGDNPASLVVEDNAPVLELHDTRFGYYYAAFRRTTRRDTAGAEIRNVRVVPFVLPTTRIIPAPSVQFTVLEIPRDDENNSTYLVVHGDKAIDRPKLRAMMGLVAPYWSEDDHTFRASWRDRFGQDRRRMKESWTGFAGVEQEDCIIALSMGPILDRTVEHMVPADRAVTRIRRLLIDCVRRVERGEDPLGVGCEDLTRVAAYDVNLAAGATWQAVVADADSFVKETGHA